MFQKLCTADVRNIPKGKTLRDLATPFGINNLEGMDKGNKLRERGK